MKQLSYIMMLIVAAVLVALPATAQQPFSVQISDQTVNSSGMTSGSRLSLGSSSSSVFSPAVPMSSWSSSGSRYSSQIVAIGQQSVAPIEPSTEGIGGPRRVEGTNFPQIPMPEPVGEVPFVLMALLAGGYAVGRRKK